MWSRIVIDWRGDFSRLSPIWAVPDGKALFVGSFQSSFRISTMQLVPLAGGKHLAVDAGNPDG
jgi:hypothetical protein